jgi:ABC-type nitrate/sulfonate/bicarbonate transport system substrate-binding protein
VLGVNAPNNIDYMLDVSVLTENGINPKSVKFPAKPIPFQNMDQALQSGQISAATLPEPFASIAEERSPAPPPDRAAPRLPGASGQVAPG